MMSGNSVRLDSLWFLVEPIDEAFLNRPIDRRVIRHLLEFEILLRRELWMILYRFQIDARHPCGVGDRVRDKVSS